MGTGDGCSKTDYEDQLLVGQHLKPRCVHEASVLVPEDDRRLDEKRVSSFSSFHFPFLSVFPD